MIDAYGRVVNMLTFQVKSGYSQFEALEIMSKWEPTLPGFRNSLGGVEADPQHWKNEDAARYAEHLMAWDEALRQTDAVA